MTREEAIRHLNTYSTTNGSGQTSQAQHEEAKRMGIKALEQESILDKIRAEIDNALSDGMVHKKTVLGIIDKYKAESEDKE